MKHFCTVRSVCCMNCTVLVTLFSWMIVNAYPQHAQTVLDMIANFLRTEHVHLWFDLSHTKTSKSHFILSLYVVHHFLPTKNEFAMNICPPTKTSPNVKKPWKNASPQPTNLKICKNQDAWMLENCSPQCVINLTCAFSHGLCLSSQKLKVLLDYIEYGLLIVPTEWDMVECDHTYQSPDMGRSKDWL